MDEDVLMWDDDDDEGRNHDGHGAPAHTWGHDRADHRAHPQQSQQQQQQQYHRQHLQQQSGGHPNSNNHNNAGGFLPPRQTLTKSLISDWLRVRTKYLGCYHTYHIRHLGHHYKKHR